MFSEKKGDGERGGGLPFSPGRFKKLKKTSETPLEPLVIQGFIACHVRKCKAGGKMVSPPLCSRFNLPRLRLPLVFPRHKKLEMVSKIPDNRKN